MSLPGERGVLRNRKVIVSDYWREPDFCKPGPWLKKFPGLSLIRTKKNNDYTFLKENNNQEKPLS